MLPHLAQFHGLHIQRFGGLFLYKLLVIRADPILALPVIHDLSYVERVTAVLRWVSATIARRLWNRKTGPSKYS